jgi:hypothetical protein
MKAISSSAAKAIFGEWKNPAIKRCLGKQPYKTITMAEKVAQRDSSRTGDLIIAYQCFDCGRFHVGHADRSQLIVRQQVERRGFSLPKDFPHCGGPIAEQRRIAAWESGNSAVFCSKKCQRKGSRKARHARRDAQAAEFAAWLESK